MYSTYFGLLAEFGAAEIRLEDCCDKYFGLSKQEANRAAAHRKLPVPAFKGGSRKSPWLVDASDLAKHIDSRRAEAQREQESLAG